jgi:hypothetical protein
MSAVIVSVPVPEELYHRLERAAARLEKPVETVLTETLQAVLPGEDEIPADIRCELVSLAALETEELRQIANSEMTADDQAALEQLLDLQNMRPLNAGESAKLETLRIEYGRILVRKARAFALLVERGQPMLF